MINKRLQPYKPTRPEFVKALLATLNNRSLYVVGIAGYTSFVVQDLQNRRFKITIGNRVRCSCDPRLDDHCIHTLFVLREVFYIDDNDPMMWQSAYLDKELRYLMANRRIKLDKISEYLKHVRSPYIRKTKPIPQEDEQGSDDEDTSRCAICYHLIAKTDPISSCEERCGYSFHLQCFKQWVQHQNQQGRSITCPLCRDEKDPELLLSLRNQDNLHKQNIATKKYGVAENYFCEGCDLKEIPQGQDVYKCVVCEDTILCQACFTGAKHIRHSFIVKKGKDKKWTMAQDRPQKRKLDLQQNLVRIKITEPKLYNFLACTVPCYFSRNTRWNILECKKLDIKIEDLSCIACEDNQKAFLRRMECGHFIHHKCLKRRIEKNKCFCKIDGTRFLLGYCDLNKRDKLKKLFKMAVTKDKQKQDRDQIEEEPKDLSEEKKKLKTQKSASLDTRDTSLKKRNLSNSGKKKMSITDLLNKSFNPW